MEKLNLMVGDQVSAVLSSIHTEGLGVVGVSNGVRFRGCVAGSSLGPVSQRQGVIAQFRIGQTVPLRVLKFDPDTARGVFTLARKASALDQPIVIEPADLSKEDRAITNGGFSTITIGDASVEQLLVLVRFLAAHPARTACLGQRAIAVGAPTTDGLIRKLAADLGVEIRALSPQEEDASPDIILPVVLPDSVYGQLMAQMRRPLTEGEVRLVKEAYSNFAGSHLSEDIIATINLPLRSSTGELLQITMRPLATDRYSGSETPKLEATFDVDTVPMSEAKTKGAHK